MSEIFQKEKREQIKSRSMLPTDALRYIEALEEIVKAAITLDSVAVSHYTQEVEYEDAQTTFHAALGKVDGMRE